ncbi:16S rRNA (uracil(1498)-N(3))-methyltransferase [Brevundimonas sp. 2R-24]|uniref:Ribosomal RNA small subunit methyltransferase E n=1 Tax=Peiella sedimenti TaxID=3061083 RepID=A0ABT8SM15_9CAUL|nr:16S rRNA (uracil(1498)-N(3))-methyltransferase [Caulobacteraceae bacterium XZ-24]
MIRLYVDAELKEAARFAPREDQARYLLAVMRQSVGDELLCFNGRDGEWRCRITAASKRGCELEAVERTREQTPASDLELVIALVKRTRLETIIEKAAELGCGRVRLAVTRRTNADHTRVDRLSAIAVEASEQTGRLDVPEIAPPEKLERLIADWPEGRTLIFCDEAGEAAPLLEAAAGRLGPASILIGPEGGFSPEERAGLRAHPAAVAVSLGPRILRADTAAIAALALWQAAAGDWRN